MLADQRPHGPLVGDRRVHGPRALGDRRRAPVREVVEHAHLRAVVRQPPREGRADEARAARDQHAPAGERARHRRNRVANASTGASSRTHSQTRKRSGSTVEGAWKRTVTGVSAYR